MRHSNVGVSKMATSPQWSNACPNIVLFKNTSGAGVSHSSSGLSVNQGFKIRFDPENVLNFCFYSV